MYLIIHEDGTIKKMANAPAEEDLNAADQGYCDIIDIDNPMNPKQWYNGWQDIKSDSVKQVG